MSDAIALALERSPSLAASAFEVQARNGEVLQAGLTPNPKLEAEHETGSGGSESTLLLGKLFELGGKPGKRTEVASRRRELGRWDHESRRLDLINGVSTAFIDVVGAQQRLDLAQQLKELADQALDTAAARVKAGKVSPIDEVRARVELSNARIALERARRELVAARKRLSANWGTTAPAFARAEGDLSQVRLLPELSRLLDRAAANPDLARWGTERAQREAALSLAEAQSVPDVTISAGNRRRDTGHSALIVGASNPLPLFDRIQGAILAQKTRLAGVEQERRAAEVSVNAEVSSTYELATAALAEVLTIQKDVLPEAQRAFDKIQEGYRLGRFGFLEVLDAQRTLFDTRRRYLDALVSYHLAVSGLERLAGRVLNTFAQSKRED